MHEAPYQQTLEKHELYDLQNAKPIQPVKYFCVQKKMYLYNFSIVVAFSFCFRPSASYGATVSQ